MRHATSAWTSGAQHDHQRPLDAAGRAEPMLIAAQLVALGWSPEVVVSSDARRTRETWEGMAPALPGTEVRYRTDLYHAGLEAFERAVGDLDPRIRTTLILGHNPGWEAIVAAMGGSDVRMGPAHAALFEGVGETWWDALAGTWQRVRVLTPEGS